MTAKPADALPNFLEGFIAESGRAGVIVVSFGAVVEEFHKDSMETMAKVFAQLKQAVIWKVQGSHVLFQVISFQAQFIFFQQVAFHIVEH